MCIYMYRYIHIIVWNHLETQIVGHQIGSSFISNECLHQGHSRGVADCRPEVELNPVFFSHPTGGQISEARNFWRLN